MGFFRRIRRWRHLGLAARVGLGVLEKENPVLVRNMNDVLEDGIDLVRREAVTPSQEVDRLKNNVRALIEAAEASPPRS